MTPTIVEKMGAQGDVLFIKVDELPPNIIHGQDAKDGRIVVAHSETGHHHVAMAENIRLYATQDPMVSYLAVESAYADIVHERPFDTHATLRFAAGVWMVKRQREAAPEGWRQVAD